MMMKKKRKERNINLRKMKILMKKKKKERKINLTKKRK